MSHLQAVSTNRAYTSASPLSQAIVFDGLLYCSGQVPVSPETRAVPEGIEAQTRQVLSNLKAIVEAAGGKMADVIKTTVFLVNSADLSGMNETYEEFFGTNRPARTTVVVAALARQEWLIEIEMVAALGASPAEP